MIYFNHGWAEMLIFTFVIILYGVCCFVWGVAEGRRDVRKSAYVFRPRTPKNFTVGANQDLK